MSSQNKIAIGSFTDPYQGYGQLDIDLQLFPLKLN